MNLTPGSATHDSRSLSVEAAQYDAQAIDAEAEVRQLEARVKAMRAKAEKARLQKQQTEAAREDAFQKEREERQTAVRESITDHHLEGIRKAINHDQHLINDLKKVAAGNIETGSNATAFVSAMVLRELVGCDDSFLTETARKVLANPDPVDATAQSELQQSQDYGPLPKHMISPKLAPKSPTPTTSPYRLPRSFQAPLALPRPSPYGRDKSPELGNEDGEVTGTLIDQDNHDFDAREPGLVAVEVGSVVETTLTTDEDDYEIQGSNEEKKAPGEIIDLDEQNDAAPSWTNDESNLAEQSLDTTSGIEYSTEQDEVIAANAHSAILKQEPPASINELASLAKHKRQSTGTINSYETDSVSASSASFHRPSTTTHEDESTFDDPRTTQPSTPIPQKSLVGLDAQVKASPASKITSGKRKRQESEAASVGRSGEITTTPASKKGKTKPKDENTGKLTTIRLLSQLSLLTNELFINSSKARCRLHQISQSYGI